MFGALPLIALTVYGMVDDKLKEKKKKEQEEKERQRKESMYIQRNCSELPGDYFERQGWHPPKNQ